jgi:hypothetical protein
MKESSLNHALKDASGSVDSEYAPDFYEEELEEELEEFDPIDEEIVAYLGNELSPEERQAFEDKMEAEPELKARVEAERVVWDALDLLDVEEPATDLTESTLDRLNSKTQLELQTVAQKFKRGRFVLIAATIVGSCALFLLGYFLFGALFPDLEKRRERDCQVVDRLEQLSAVESFEYLSALTDAKLFAPRSKRNETPQDSERGSNVGFSIPDFAPQPKRTYAELSQDRAFYRRELQFENLEESERQRYRALYRQIERAPNSEELWTTANAYVFWLTTAVNASELERLQEDPIPERIEFIRHKQEFFRRMNEYFSRATASNPNVSRGPGEQPRMQQRMRGAGEPGTQEDRSPTALAIRLTLPEEFQDEDLTPIYRRYEEFRGERSANPQQGAPQGAAPEEDVFAFLTDVSSQELIELLSPQAQEYLLEKPDADRAAAIGLLVSLSFLENDGEASSRPQPGRGQGLSRQPFGGRRFAAGPFRGSPWEQQGAFGRGGFMNPNNDVSVEKLGETLRNAPMGVKSYIVSNSPQAAMAVLLGLHWSLGRAPSDPSNAPPGQGNRRAPQRGYFNAPPAPDADAAPSPAPDRSGESAAVPSAPIRR